MHKGRLEAFSDGVLAIILTIMVLELKVPKEASLAALAALWPVWAAYVLSYCIVFLVWLNHHDIFAGVNEVNARLLFINGGLLFCVSLIPFATAFAGETHWASPLAVALYGAVMVAVSLMFVRLRLAAALQAKDEAAAAHHRREAALSTRLAVLFVAGTALGWFYPRMALVVFAATPLVMRLRRKPGASADGTRD